MLHFIAFLTFVALAAATVTNDTVAVCQYLYNKYPAYVAWDPLGLNGLESAANASVYNDINTIYWNAKNSQLRAACAFFPASAEQVSDAVKELNKYPSVRFALKSGGHNPAPGFSATDGGVIISFEPNLNGTVRSADGKHFVVGVGSRWGDVYTVTSQTNQVVVGGRLAHIGVGGLTLGGGLSYYSAQYGLACDNVDNFEVVLADGTIANANRTSHPDLWWSLRGGGNQFAIVTRLTLQAHPLGDNGQIWGGVRTYTGDQRLALFRAITNFARDYPDAKAAVIPTFQFGAITESIFFFFYDGATPPAGVFDEFNAINSTSDDTATRSYLTLVNEDGGASQIGFGNSFRVNTVPNLPADQMVEFFDHYYNRTASQAVNNTLSTSGFQLMGFDPQPLSVRIAKASRAQGGNALGLDPGHGDRFWIENDFLWSDPLCYDVCPTLSQHISDELMAYQKQTFAGVPPTNYRYGGVQYVNYNPLFMNDAAPYQDVYSSYGERNLRRLQRVKRRYDPTGFLTNRQGGFKLPSDDCRD